MTPLFAAPATIAAPITTVTAPAEEAATQTPDSMPAPDGRTPGAPEFKLEVGGTYGQFFTIPTYGGEVSAAFGSRLSESCAFFFGAHVELGRTREGLPMWGAHPNAELEWIAGPLRLGAEGRVGFLAVKRITEDDWLAGVSIGAGVHLGVDLMTLRSGVSGASSSALYLQLSGRADFYDDPLALGASLSLGYRWDRATRL